MVECAKIERHSLNVAKVIFNCNYYMFSTTRLFFMSYLQEIFKQKNHVVYRNLFQACFAYLVLCHTTMYECEKSRPPCK
jgi:hypothetical protein